MHTSGLELLVLDGEQRVGRWVAHAYTYNRFPLSIEGYLCFLCSAYTLAKYGRRMDGFDVARASTAF
jgi:hypothetical protein